METPLLDAIKTAAWWQTLARRVPYIGVGALGLGAGVGGASLYFGAQQNKLKQQGYNDAMREMGPLLAARHMPQGAMTLRAHQRPMA